MSHYLLATYRVAGSVPEGPQSPDEMKSFMESVIELEEDMEEQGVFVFGGALTETDAASVVRSGDLMLTDGPFAEAKEQIAGFYIIEAADESAARDWARRVADATQHAIELRPFAATGRLKDNMPG